MPRTRNMIRVICDRCGKMEYLQDDNDPKKNSWFDIARYTAMGGAASQYLFCSECNREYQMLLNKQDSEFNDFKANTKEA